MGFFKNGSKKDGEDGEVLPAADSAAAAAPVAASGSEAPAAVAAGSGRPPTSPLRGATTAAAATSDAGASPSAASATAPNYDTDGGNRTDGAETDEEGAVDDLEDGKELDEDLEWDEGGPSQCGYSEPFHGVLMSAGAAIHRVVGDPGEGVKVGMRRIGNFFQEASYAVRDVVRGDAGVKDDARNAWKEMVGRSAPEGEDEGEDGAGPAEEEEGKENGGSPAAAGSPTAAFN